MQKNLTGVGGVFSIYQPFSSDSSERASEHSHTKPILGAGWAGRCRAKMGNLVHVDSLCFIGAKVKLEPTLCGEAKERHEAASLCKRQS